MRISIFISLFLLFTCFYSHSQKSNYYINEAYKTFDQSFDAQSAIIYIDSALILDPNNAQLYYVRGHIQNIENPFNGLEDYNKCLELDPQNADAHRGIGHLLKMKGQYDEAKPYFEKAYALDPSQNNALALARLTDSPQKRLDLLQEALDTNSIDSWIVYEEIGEAYLDLKDYKSSLLNYKKALKNPLSEFSGRTYENLGDAYLGLGHVDGACRLWNMAKEDYTEFVLPTEEIEAKIKENCTAK